MTNIKEITLWSLAKICFKATEGRFHLPLLVHFRLGVEVVVS